MNVSLTHPRLNRNSVFAGVCGLLVATTGVSLALYMLAPDYAFRIGWPLLLPPLASIPGLPCSIRGYRQVKRSEGAQYGAALAYFSGLVNLLGVVFVLFALLAALLFVGWLFLFAYSYTQGCTPGQHCY